MLASADPSLPPEGVQQDLLTLTGRVKSAAVALGFCQVGVAPASAPDHWGFYQDWLEKGHAGLMGYLGRNLDRRADVRKVLPGARSAVCVAMDYDPPEGHLAASDGPRGQVARYARGDDYHDVMGTRLEALAEAVKAEIPGCETRPYVDTGPILERDLAARAGLGWFGKHTNLIDKRRGSWFFLGEVITTAALACDTPVANHCGTCTRCLDACPTGALPEPYLLDSSRCISYLTIELKGAIPRSLRPLVGNHVFGCDVCQEVCPWNQKHGRPASDSSCQPRPEVESPPLRDLLALDQAAFSRRFKGSPIKRAKRRGLLRNAAVALGNVGGPADVTALATALEDLEPLVRAHAAWALGRIGGNEANCLLTAALDGETDCEVMEEMREALVSLDGNAL